MVEKISTWEDVIINFQHFNSSIETSKSIAYDRLSSYYHWYYLPSLNIFAPSKFIGYKNMTLFSYKGDGSGTDTQKALSPFFKKLDKNSNEYKGLLIELEQFFGNMEKTISKKVTEGTGGIYIPKIEYNDKLILNQDLLNQITKDLNSNEEENDTTFTEGGNKKERLVSYYERKPSLRIKAIEIHGFTCKVCGFNFEKYYGIHGANYIEVHHIKPISQLIDEEQIDPKHDLIVLCANCHRMVHRNKNNVLTTDELKTSVENNLVSEK